MRIRLSRAANEIARSGKARNASPYPCFCRETSRLSRPTTRYPAMNLHRVTTWTAGKHGGMFSGRRGPATALMQCDLSWTNNHNTILLVRTLSPPGLRNTLRC